MGRAAAPADKAAEIRAELAEAAATPALGTVAAAGTSTGGAVGQLVSQQLEAPEVAQAASARQLGLHLCGHDVEGVSIAGQVRGGGLVLVVNRLCAGLGERQAGMQSSKCACGAGEGGHDSFFGQRSAQGGGKG